MPVFAEAPPLVRRLRIAASWLLRRFAPAAGCTERSLAVEERVAIGPKKSLILVRCHGRRFLVASAGDTVGPFVEIAPPKAARRPRTEREA